MLPCDVFITCITIGFVTTSRFTRRLPRLTCNIHISCICVSRVVSIRWRTVWWPNVFINFIWSRNPLTVYHRALIVINVRIFWSFCRWLHIIWSNCGILLVLITLKFHVAVIYCGCYRSSWRTRCILDSYKLVLWRCYSRVRNGNSLTRSLYIQWVVNHTVVWRRLVL